MRKVIFKMPVAPSEISWARWENKLLLQQEQMELAALKQLDQDDDLSLLSERGSNQAAQAELDEVFFRQYDNPTAHIPLLSDESLNAAWQLAIGQLGEKHIKGKVVLDLGCGPGQLAVLCAKAGASQVIAVEASKAMAQVAEQVALANGVSKIVSVFHGQVEELTLSQRADVIVSNFCGPALVTGGMTASLAYARSRLLKPGGLVLPSHGSLQVAGIQDRESLAAAKSQWDAGFASGVSLGAAMPSVVATPRVATLLRNSQLATSASNLVTLDLSKVTLKAAMQGWPSLPFSLSCTRDERLFGLCLWFNLEWRAPPSPSASSPTSPPSQEQPSPHESQQGIAANKEGNVAARFTTDPRGSDTHFKQVILSFPRSLQVIKGQELQGTLGLTPSGPSGRDLTLTLTLNVGGAVATSEYTLLHSAPWSCAQTSSSHSG